MELQQAFVTISNERCKRTWRARIPACTEMAMY